MKGVKKMSILTPDFRFCSVYDITVPFLQKKGIKGLILDIDNTLVYYGIHRPTEANTNWINSVTSGGIKMSFVSNGYEQRVKEYNEDFGFYYSFKSGKPKKGGFLKAAQSMGLSSSEIAVVGDQIYTDIWGGNRSGMKTILVDPISMEPWPSFKIKRRAERPVLAKCKYTEVER